MRYKKSTYSNSESQENKKDKSENIDDDFTDNIVDKEEESL